MNMQTEPFAGRLISDAELDNILCSIQYTPTGQETVTTRRGVYTVKRAGNRVVLTVPKGQRFVLALGSDVPYLGGWPIGADDIEGALLLPAIVEDPPRRLRPEGTITARPMTDVELAGAVELYALGAGVWNSCENDRGLPLLGNVIGGIRIVDLAPRAGGQVFELIDVDGCATGLYAALRTPGWDKWTGRKQSPDRPFSFRRAVLERDDVAEAWWLVNPVARTAALWRQAVRKAGH